jgi:hypothetical protein
VFEEDVDFLNVQESGFFFNFNLRIIWQYSGLALARQALYHLSLSASPNF